MADIRALTGLSGQAALELARRLVVQVIVRRVTDQAKFVLADHLPELIPHRRTQKISIDQNVDVVSRGADATEQVTEQVSKRRTDQVEFLQELSPAQWAIVEHTDVPRSLTELVRIAGYAQRPHFKPTHLGPLIAGGITGMTAPEKPTSPKQKYVLTEAGLNLKLLRLDRDAESAEKEDS